MSSTPKQKRAVKNIVESSRTETLGKSLKKAGYSENTAIKPSQVTESKGFQEAMNEAGLTDTFLNKCLSEDIKKKPQNRKAEVELAYKLKGRLSDKIDLTSQGEAITGITMIRATKPVDEPISTREQRKADNLKDSD